jgi:hypothetical protein
MGPLRVGALEQDEVFRRGPVVVLTEEGLPMPCPRERGSVSAEGADAAGGTRSAAELVSVRTAVDGLECSEVRYA